MKHFMFALVLMCTLMGVAFAQEETANDRLSIYGGFAQINTTGVTLSARGFNGGAQLAVYKYEGVKIEGVADYTVLRSDGVTAHTLLFGPQFAVNLVRGRVTPFGRLLFGETYVLGGDTYTHSVGGGIDVNVTNRLTIRPFQFDRVNVEGSGQVNRIAAGIRIRLF